MDKLQEINDALHDLLLTPKRLELAPPHAGDDLMVWFLLGGKDVGKTTFLNSLLGTRISDDSPEEAEGTSCFVAYVHDCAADQLESRLCGLSIQLRFHTHQSETHRRLCIIDSPDFDSRYERHVAQVRLVLGSGAADGAVLLASPSKYKDTEYWRCFDKLSAFLSPHHILFVLTKADEVGAFVDDVRRDFSLTVSKRVRTGLDLDPEDSVFLGQARVFAIDSHRKSLDFDKLDSTLLKKLSARDVRGAQEENRRHAIARGVERLRAHHRLDEVAQELQRAREDSRIDEILEDHFPDSYFSAVRTRLAHDRTVAAEIRNRMSSKAGAPLAGVQVFLSAARWLTDRLLLVRSLGRGRILEGAGRPDMARLSRWDQEELDERLARARRSLCAGLPAHVAGHPLTPEEDKARLLDELLQLFEDHLAQVCRPRFSRMTRLILNVPVYMYLVLFVTLLCYPVFLVLRAFHVLDLPALAEILTVDNVKLSIAGFAGYYLMAAVYSIRKQRERIQQEMDDFSDRFIVSMRDCLLYHARLALTRFAEAFDRLERELETLVR